MNLYRFSHLITLFFLIAPVKGAETDFIWCGAVTPTSVRVKAGIRTHPADVQVWVSSSPDMSSATLSPVAQTSAASVPVDVKVEGLEPDTSYFYALAVNGVLDSRRGRFTTLPQTGTAHSFAILIGACAGDASGNGKGGSASNHPVFKQMVSEPAQFYLNIGDVHYSDIPVNDVSRFRNAYRQLHTAPRQRDLFERFPFVYIWDDHDFGPNNSDSRSRAKPAAQTVFREFIPHYPLAESGQQTPVYHSFTVGRVKFILTDLRSERDGTDKPDTSEKTFLGDKQKTWLKSELIDGGTHNALIVWVSTVPWIQKPESRQDNWGGAAKERAELAAFIQENRIRNLIMIAGDAHMIAADDGSNNTYADGEQPGFPVLQCAALHRKGSVKGGPYSEGTFPNPNASFGQYGILSIRDEETEPLTIRFTGKRVDEEGKTTTVLEYSHSFPRQ